MRPYASGRPGFIAIFQNSTSPSLSSSCLTKSASPTDTPPDVMTTSAAAWVSGATVLVARPNGVKNWMLSHGSPKESASSATPGSFS